MTVQAFLVAWSTDFDSEHIDLRLRLAGPVDATNSLELRTGIGDGIAGGTTLSDVEGSEQNEMVALGLKIQASGVLKVEQQDTGPSTILVCHVGSLIVGNFLVLLLDRVGGVEPRTAKAWLGT